MELVLIGIYVLFFLGTGVIGAYFISKEVVNPDPILYMALVASSLCWPLTLAALIIGFMPIIWLDKQQKEGLRILHKWGDHAQISVIDDPRTLHAALVEAVKKISTKDLSTLSKCQDLLFSDFIYGKDINPDPYKILMIIFDELVERGIMDE